MFPPFRVSVIGFISCLRSSRFRESAGSGCRARCAGAHEKSVARAAAIREKADLDAIRHQIQLANANPDLTRRQRQEIINGLLEKERKIIHGMILAQYDLIAVETDPSRITQIEAQIEALERRAELIGDGTPKKQKSIINARDQYDDSHDGSQLTAGEGIEAGIYGAANQLGSAGEAISDLFSGTLLDSVNAISDGIYGWITGTESFGDVLRNLGDSIFKEMLNTIIRIGAQWLINTILIKTGIISIGAVQDAQRQQQTQKQIAAQTATLPTATANAAATGISSWGLALVFGALAIALILAATGAFATGGPVTGGKQLAWLNDGIDGEEYVIRGAARSKYGDTMLAQINAGTYAPSIATAALADAPIDSPASPAAALAQARGSAPASAGQGAAAAATDTGPSASKITFGFYDSRAGALDALRTVEGQKILIDIASDNRGEMGIPT